MAPAVGLAVRFGAATEVVALHDAGETLAFGRTDHVHDFALLEHTGVDARAELEVVDGVSGHLAQGFEALPIWQTRFAQMPLVWACRTWFGAEAQLDRNVAVGFGRTQLSNEARTSLD